MRNRLAKKDVVAYARSLGFPKVGVTSAAALERDEQVLASWLARGHAGEMDYLQRAPALRSRPEELLPGAKSVIALAMPYFPGRMNARAENEGKISRYAWGRDYHKLIRKRLESLARYIESGAPQSVCRAFVDTGPLLERAFARRAGLGFVGKNTMLITRGLGSWVFLASVITTAEWEPDAPDARSCGECRRCIDACPTGAITAPYEIDARRCIAYLTIESRGPVDEPLRRKMDGWIYGCDVCQDVCPHNTRVPPSAEPAFDAATPSVSLRTLLSIRGEGDFRRIFDGTAMRRAGWQGMVRNACVAAGSLGRTDLIPELRALSEAAPPMIRSHARAALAQLDAVTALE